MVACSSECQRAHRTLNPFWHSLNMEIKLKSSVLLATTSGAAETPLYLQAQMIDPWQLRVTLSHHDSIDHDYPVIDKSILRFKTHFKWMTLQCHSAWICEEDLVIGRWGGNIPLRISARRNGKCVPDHCQLTIPCPPSQSISKGGKCVSPLWFYMTVPCSCSWFAFLLCCRVLLVRQCSHLVFIIANMSEFILCEGPSISSGLYNDHWREALLTEARYF